jgi:hypothetical protein
MRCLSRLGRGAEKARDCGCVAPGFEVGGIHFFRRLYAGPDSHSHGWLIREAKRAGGLLIDLSAWF